MEIEVPIRKQFVPLFEGAARFMVVVAHRRAGKTVAGLQRLLVAALDAKAPAARYAFVAPYRHQAKNVAWDYLKAMSRSLPGRDVNESELWIRTHTGAKVMLYGADNVDALRGGYLDGVVMDEVAQMDPRAWDEVVRPMLADRGGWALFIGTPQGRNQFHRLFHQADSTDGWGRLMLKASETGLVPKVELDAAKSTMSPEAYAQEWECSFTSATRGAYYGALMEAARQEGRITRVPYDPAHGVITAWDLGVRDATSIWFCQKQKFGGTVHVIDYLEGSGVGLDWYAKQLQAKGYSYLAHIAPHDIEVTELGTGKSRRDVAAEHGIAFMAQGIYRKLSLMDGIEQARTLIPRCVFDEERCARGIDALSLYRAEWDPKLEALRGNPLHDWTSHAADAFRYLAVSLDLADDTWAPMPMQGLVR